MLFETSFFNINGGWDFLVKFCFVMFFGFVFGECLSTKKCQKWSWSLRPYLKKL